MGCNSWLCSAGYVFPFSRYSLLSFGMPQLYNSEALPFTYVVIELADKLYNSVTVFVFVLHKSMSFT